MKRTAAFGILLAAACVAWQSPSAGQGGGRSASAARTTYVRLGGREAASDAVLYEPAAGSAKNGIALMFGHPSESNFNHPSAREMARRGYRILMVNVQEGRLAADLYAPAYSAAVKYLRGLAGVDQVVIITHSGGGHEMSFY